MDKPYKVYEISWDGSLNLLAEFASEAEGRALLTGNAEIFGDRVLVQGTCIAASGEYQ